MRRPREPLGTTRKGQALLGILALVASVGWAAGLLAMPATFEPLTAYLLRSVRWTYEPTYRLLTACFIVGVGLLLSALCLHAFLLEPIRNRSIDAHLRGRQRLDRSVRAPPPSDA